MRTQQFKNPKDLTDPALTQNFELRPALAKGSVITLTDVLAIGRDPNNDLVINDQFASQRHARIERKTDGRYVLRDLRSTNGTYVNGSRAVECFLKDGDRISFGETEYVFTNSVHHEPLQLTSKNAQWAVQLEQIQFFARTDFSVLVLGPSGSGKEVIARSIHDQSMRSKHSFVSVNCSALTENLVESELFGHVRGSFTGATHDRKGAFETARDGTLFLDEIGDLPMSLQPKLLRALENSEIRPVGSDRIIKTNVRILAATHQNLQELVQSGHFRSDLYYRLNVIRITAPSLKERIEDLDDLVHYFCRMLRVRISMSAILKMQEHTWPGNIRELKNVIARAAACFPNQHIQPEHLDYMIDRPMMISPKRQLTLKDRSVTVRELQKQIILERLIQCRGNQRQTAFTLGIAKSTLHDKLRAFGIDPRAIAKQNLDETITSTASTPEYQQEHDELAPE